MALPVDVRVLTFFDARTTDGTSTDYIAPQGGEYIFYVSGTFDGATVKLQYLPLGHTQWNDQVGASFTAYGGVVVAVGHGNQYRAVQTGSGASTSLTATFNLANDKR